MNAKEREQIERLIAQLEDPKQVRDAYVIPSGHTRQFADGYKAGAQMQAGAVAMALRGICGMPTEDDEVVVSAMRRRSSPHEPSAAPRETSEYLAKVGLEYRRRA